MWGGRRKKRGVGRAEEAEKTYWVKRGVGRVEEEEKTDWVKRGVGRAEEEETWMENVVDRDQRKGQ